MEPIDIDLTDRTTIDLPREAPGRQSALTRTQAAALYTSHALSTWNARTYEFAAILFTAAAFPDTLLASSIRGISNTIAALCLSGWIGSCIDRASSRQWNLIITISANRASVLFACLGWILLIRTPQAELTATPELQRLCLFAVVIVLGICEKLSGIGNMISMERDWVPVLASQSAHESTSPYGLTQLNTFMRRIDLVCKLIAPIIISAIISVTSTRIGCLVVGLTSFSCWGIEMWTARHVWNTNPQLRESKAVTSREYQPPSPVVSVTTERHSRGSGLKVWWASQTQQFRVYFSSDIWIPSLSLSLLHLSVLSYSATFITFLLNSGFSLFLITIARSVGSVVEVSSTFVAPVGIEYLSRSAKNRVEDPEDRERLLSQQGEQSFEANHLVGLSRGGLWGVTMQLASLVPVVLAIWNMNTTRDSTNPSTLLSRILIFANPPGPFHIITLSMFAFLSFSRLGLWVFDLTTQEITQTRIPEDTRSAFAGTEMSFVSLFELAQWIVAAVWSRPDQFRWLALMSFGAVTCASVMYAYWVRRQRGHLMHLARLGKKCWGGK